MSDTQHQKDEIFSELSKLGDNFGKMFQSFWESEEIKSMQREVKAGLEQMSRNLNQAADTARVDNKVKKAGEQVKGAWESAHGPQIVTEMRQGFVDSLKYLNQQVEKMATPKAAEEVKPEKPAEPPPATPPEAGEGI